MQSGKLNKKVTINKPSDEQTAEGYDTGKVIKVFGAKANVRILSASDLIKAGVELTKEYASIKMRYNSKIQFNYSLNYNGNEYSINSIRPDDKNKEMIVTVSRDIA